MKVKKFLVGLICLMVVCLGFAGCEWGKKYTLELTVNDTNMGTVVSKPAQNEYQKDTQISVVASSKDDSKYEFVNWIDFESKSVVSEVNTYTFNIEKNTKLQAVFKKIVYFKYELDGGKVAEGEKINDINIGGATQIVAKRIELNDVVNLPKLEKAGYDFLGWSLSLDPETIVTTATYTVLNISNDRADIVATAKFRESKTVHFDLDGGSIAEDGKIQIDGIDIDINNYDNNKKITDGTGITLPTLTKTGYTFKGWQLLNKNGNVITDNISAGTYTLTSSNLNGEGNFITFKAKFTAKKYPLELKVKRETIEGDTTTATWETIDSTKELIYDQPIGDLIKFNNESTESYTWYYDDTLSDLVNSSDKWTPIDPTIQNATLYGKVTAVKTFTIKVNDQESTTHKIFADDEKTYNILTDILKFATDTVPTKEGHTFAGFKLVKDSTIVSDEVVPELSYSSSNDGIYEAQFTVNKYNVTFDKTGNENRITYEGYTDETVSVDYNTLIKFKANANPGYKITNVYYTLEGSEDKNLLTADTDGYYSFNLPAKNVTVKAETLIEYTVNYYNGETKLDVSGDAIVTKLIEGSTDLGGKRFHVLPDFDKNFCGWALTNGGKAVITREGAFTEGFWDAISKDSTEINLYVRWEDPTYKYTYTFAMDKSGPSIVPLVSGSSYYQGQFNNNVNFYAYLTYLKQTYGNRLESIKANTNIVTASNCEEIMAYNLFQIFNLPTDDNDDAEVVARSVLKYENLIVMNNGAIVNKNAQITVKISDNKGNQIISNGNGAITLKALKSLSGNLNIRFVFQETI